VGDPTSAVTLAAIKEIITKTKAARLFAGIHTGSAEGAKKMTGEMGFDFATILADTALLSNAAKAAVASFRGGAAAKAGGPY
jgi:2-keto-3-deoxy-L-rhamnonate aldolase RhmA